MKIFLIGYRGTGKSTVGRQLAVRLGWPFVDSDSVIASEAGQSISQIFATQGEAAFRQAEADVIARLATGPDGVVALGGGAILREENRQAIRHAGIVIWLVASPQVLTGRIQDDAHTAAQRPSLTNLQPHEEIQQVLAEREPLYRQCADREIDTESMTPPEVVEAILSSIGDRLSS